MTTDWQIKLTDYRMTGQAELDGASTVNWMDAADTQCAGFVEEVWRGGAV